MATSEKFFFTLYISLLNKRKMDNYIPHDKKPSGQLLKHSFFFLHNLAISCHLAEAWLCQINVKFKC